MFTQHLTEQTETVKIFLNGHPLHVPKGSTVAAAILVHNLPFTRTTPVSGSKRAPFCMMGVCYECLMVIDGNPGRRTCSTYVKEGMQIDTQIKDGPKIMENSHE